MKQPPISSPPKWKSPHVVIPLTASYIMLQSLRTHHDKIVLAMAHPGHHQSLLATSANTGRHSDAPVVRIVYEHLICNALHPYTEYPAWIAAHHSCEEMWGVGAVGIPEWGWKYMHSQHLGWLDEVTTALDVVIADMQFYGTDDDVF